MWQNLGTVVGNAIQQVKKIQTDLENQLDEAVGKVDTSVNSGETNATTTTLDEVGLESKTATLSQEGDDENLKISEIKPIIKEEISVEETEQLNPESTSNTSELKEVTSSINDTEILSTEKKPNSRSRRSRQKKIEDSINTNVTANSIVPSGKLTGSQSSIEASFRDDDIIIQDKEHTNPIEPILIDENCTSHESSILSSDHGATGSIAVEKEPISTSDKSVPYESKLADVTEDHSLKLRIAEADAHKLKEVVAERERALETAMTKMHELNQQLETSQEQLKSLKGVVAEKNKHLEQLSSDGDLKSKLKKLQDVLTEKEERLNAFEVEGQGLSKKQGENEKLIRQLKKDLKERGDEVGKLKESKEQFVKAIEEMQEVIRKNEAEINNTSKSMAAMAAVNQASNEKMMRLEAEINSRSEELVSQRKALEVAWSESNEAKRVLVEVRAERDELKRQLGEGNSKFMETESSRRDVEQREAILKATSKQLQDSLQRQQSDFSTREERLREEANEMRKRWQEAISSRESLATELASSTAPLLRQISSLQDSIRSKSESWQNMEASLTERAFKAEKAAEAAEKKRTTSEEQLISLKDQLELTIARLDEHKEKLLAIEGQHSQLQKASAAASDQVRELQSQLYFEIGQKQNLQTLLHEVEIKKNIEMQEMKATLEDSVMKAEVRISQLQSEKDSYFVDFKEGQNSKTGVKPVKLLPSSGPKYTPSAVKCKLYWSTFYSIHSLLKKYILFIICSHIC